MTDPLNPYAVTRSGTALGDPIHIAGKLTRDDLLMSLRDAPPTKGFARLQYPIAAVVILFAVGLADFMLADDDQPVLSVAWMIVAFTILPGWLALSPKLTPTYRERVHRIGVMAKNQRDEYGWFEQSHFVLRAGDSVFRARWSFFDRCLVFPTHILLPMVSDPTRRLVVPYRFFSAAEDAREVCQFLREKVGLLIDQPPSDAYLANQVSGTERAGRVEFEQARHWSKDQWPLQSSPSPQFDWVISLTAGQTVVGLAFKAAAAILFVLLFSFLPVWVATAAWLVNDYLFFGDWGFLGQRPWSTILVLGPGGFLVVYFLYLAVGSIFRARNVQAHAMGVRMRSVGVHLSHHTFESWFPWTDTAGVIVEAERAGWISRESMEEIHFAKLCFDGEDQFEAFKIALRQFDSASGSS